MDRLPPISTRLPSAAWGTPAGPTELLQGVLGEGAAGCSRVAMSGTAAGGSTPARGNECLRSHNEQFLTRELPDAGKEVEVLLNRHSFSLDNTDTSGLTPLHWAAAKGKLGHLAKFPLHACALSSEKLAQAKLQHEAHLLLCVTCGAIPAAGVSKGRM